MPNILPDEEEREAAGGFDYGYELGVMYRKWLIDWLTKSPFRLFLLALLGLILFAILFFERL